jgi:SAM-dependent methyltransferase
MPTPGSCAVCGATTLRPHLRVAGDAGPDGLIPTTKRFGVALSDIVRCSRCGHMQLARMPDEEELSEAYGTAGSDDYVGEEAGQRASAAAVLARVEAHTTPGRILDVGCWLGFLLAEARDRGWQPVGLEPSDFASAWARDRLGLDVRTAGIEAIPPDERFEAVVMADVIEHLLDPADALTRVRAALAPGGVLALVLPDAGSALARAMGRRWWSVIPTHVQYFSRASLTRLLESNGFVTLELATAPKAFTVRYYLERIEGYSSRLSHGLVAAAERARLADRIWAPDFRDRMLVLARPTD